MNTLWGIHSFIHSMHMALTLCQILSNHVTITHSLKLPNGPLKWALLLYPITDEETEAENQVTCQGHSPVNGRVRMDDGPCYPSKSHVVHLPGRPSIQPRSPAHLPSPSASLQEQVQMSALLGHLMNSPSNQLHFPTLLGQHNPSLLCFPWCVTLSADRLIFPVSSEDTFIHLIFPRLTQQARNRHSCV